jgi:protein-S-isoprenylcysteine O-methyltransferase Ste14
MGDLPEFGTEQSPFPTKTGTESVPYLCNASSHSSKSMSMSKSMSKSKSSNVSLSGIGRYRLIYGYIMCVVALVLAKGDVLIPGLVVAVVGIALRIWSAGYIEKNNRLATGGPYSLCRNPLYLGSFTFGAGSCIAIHVWWLLPVYAAGFALFYWPTILNEQRFLSKKFGDDYADFRRRTPSFIPYKIVRGGTGQFSLEIAKVNREHLHAMVSIVFLALLAVAAHFRA